MTAKAFLVLCIQAFLAQFAFSQCVNPAAFDATRYPASIGLSGHGFGLDRLAYDGLGLEAAWPARGLGIDCGAPAAVDITPTSGGGLIVSSASAIPPVGVAVASDNMYEGILAAAGELPFVGTVGVDGVVPTAGAGAVNYGCGNGVTVMESVADVLPPGIGGFGSAVIAPAAAIAAPVTGYRASWVSNEWGCGL